MGVATTKIVETVNEQGKPENALERAIRKQKEDACEARKREAKWDAQTQALLDAMYKGLDAIGGDKNNPF